MGGALKSIGSAVVGGLKDIGSSVIKTVAPAAVDMLKNIVGSGVDTIANAAKGLVGKLPIVGPLASGLIDKLAPGLKNLATGGVESLLNKLTSSITDRLAPGTGGQTLSLPSLFQRFQEIIKQSTGAATTAATSSTAAASTSSAATSSSSAASSSGSTSASSAGWSGGPPDSANYKMDDPGGVAKFNADFQKYQMAMNTVQEAGKRASDLEKARHDALMGLIANIK